MWEKRGDEACCGKLGFTDMTRDGEGAAGDGRIIISNKRYERSVLNQIAAEKAIK